MKILLIIGIILLLVVLVAVVGFLVYGFNLTTWITESIGGAITAFFKALLFDWWAPS